MRILYLLFPFFLLLLQGTAGSTLAIGNEKQCQQRKGFCALLKCPNLSLITGKCSRFYFCCKR
ncbi:AMP1 protein, partial [Thinocorus orbignyianus]|nr:AMP1 protein [Thinocorus orbignyianus]